MFNLDAQAIFDRHAWLLRDTARMAAYDRAIAGIVRPGDAVLDLGSGIGILSFFACRAGARRVYAVESDLVALLSEVIASANGFADRVVVLNESSYAVSLPEPVDVIVTDTLHTFGLQGGVLGSVIDARRRFLKAGGAVIPRAIELFVVPVELPVFSRMVDFWNTMPGGFDFSAVHGFVTNNIHSVALEPDEFRATFLGEPGLLLPIRLCEIENPNVRGEASLLVSRNGEMNGIGGWFAADLADGVVLSNAPDADRVAWKYAIFPFDRPVAVEAGQRLRITIASSSGLSWAWRVERDGRVIAERASLGGFPLSTETVRRLAPTYAPARTANGDAELCLLQLFDGVRTVGELEEELRRRFPDRFSSPGAAAVFVREMVERCS